MCLSEKSIRFIKLQNLHPSVNVRSNQSRFVPFLVVGLGGVLGVSVDLFDILAVAIGGPEWLYQLDVLTAVLLTIGIGCLDTYSRRRARARQSTGNSQRHERAD